MRATHPKRSITARTGLKNGRRLLNQHIRDSRYCIFLDARLTHIMLHLGGCSIWVATIALDEDHGRKADIVLVRALWSLDADSSPSVLRIVDLIATGDSGDGRWTMLRPYRITDRFRNEERKVTSGSAREGARSPFAALFWERTP